MCEKSYDPAIRRGFETQRTLADTARIHPQWPFPSPVCVFCGFRGGMCECAASAFGRMLADYRDTGSRPDKWDEKRADIGTSVEERDGRIWRTSGWLNGDDSAAASNRAYLTGDDSPLRPGDWWTRGGYGGGDCLYVIDTPRVRALVFAELDRYPVLDSDGQSQLESEREWEAVHDWGFQEIGQELAKRWEWMGNEWDIALDDGVKWELYRAGSEWENVNAQDEGEGHTHIDCKRVAQGIDELISTYAALLPRMTGTVCALASGILSDHAYDRCPVLADALEDAGMNSDNDAGLLHTLRNSHHQFWEMHTFGRIMKPDVTDSWLHMLASAWCEWLATPTEEELEEQARAAEAYAEHERHIANRERTLSIPGM